jgi:protein-tyrosine phosphatase
MVDIHCHLLPGLDDGPESLEVSIEMVKIAHAAGTTDIVATPHANSQYEFDPEQISQKIAELKAATGNVVNIHGGCDFHLSATNIQDALANPAKYTINQRSYLLVEFSDFLIPPTMDEIFDRMRSVGIIPVITHPERNRLLHTRVDQIRTWAENECRVQVTAQSFLGRFGRAAKAFSETLMKEHLIHFVASDGHDPKDRPPVLIDAFRYIADTYSEAEAEALFITNPACAVAGEDLDLLPPPATKRTWFDAIKDLF